MICDICERKQAEYLVFTMENYDKANDQAKDYDDPDNIWQLVCGDCEYGTAQLYTRDLSDFRTVEHISTLLWELQKKNWFGRSEAKFKNCIGRLHI